MVIPASWWTLLAHEMRTLERLVLTSAAPRIDKNGGRNRDVPTHTPASRSEPSGFEKRLELMAFLWISACQGVLSQLATQHAFVADTPPRLRHIAKTCGVAAIG